MELNRFPPPPRRFYSELVRRGSSPPLGLDIGGYLNEFHGLDPDLRAALQAHYGPFVLSASHQESFRIEVLDGVVDHFIPPESGIPRGPHPLSLGWEEDLLLAQSYGFAGWYSFRGGEGGLALARAEYERASWCVENYLRILTAWRAVGEGGVLLHAASLVRSGRASIFFGSSGSGKSTLAATSREGAVVSDDLTLIRREEGEYRVWATPFRGTYTGGPTLQGAYPIAGLYRIFKSEENRLEACPRGHAIADLLAASPFVVDQISREGRILDNLRALDSAHPIAYLHFNRSGDFWGVLSPA